MTELLTSISGEHTLTFNEKSHRYRLDDKPVKSITGIGSAYPKGDALAGWKIEQGALFVLDMQKAYYKEHEKFAAKSSDVYKDWLKDSKTAFTKLMKQAASIGTVVHDYAYALQTRDAVKIKKALDDVKKHVDSIKALKAAGAVDEWWAKNTDHELFKEEIVASPILQIAGKFDRYVIKDNRYGVADFKTSKRISIEQFQQCAGYDILTQEWRGYKAQFYEIVHVSKDTGGLAIGMVDNQGYWLNGKLIMPDTDMFMDQQMQFRRNVPTLNYIRKYKDFWKDGNEQLY